MEGTDEQKAAYAALLFEAGIKPNAAFEAACKLFPSDIGIALYVSQYWPIDPFVKSKIAEYRDTNPDGALPKRHVVAQEAYAIYLDTTVSTKERINALKLYSQIMGYLTGEDTGGKDRLPYPQPVYKVVSQ